MKKLWLAALAASVAGGAMTVNSDAQAEVYVGVFGGVAQGNTDFNFSTPAVPLGEFDIDGSLFGANVGAGKTFSNNVYLGVEADYADADVSGGRPCPNPAFSCDTEVNAVTTLRARLGREAGPWLFYGTIGAAWADVHVETVLAGVAVGESNWRNGWAGGIGVERDLGPHLSVRGEITRYDIGEGTSSVHAGEGVETEVEFTALRLGVNWTF